jgi:hypothetical protein
MGVFWFGDFVPYCVKCGAPLMDNDKFCTVCGAAVPKFTREEFTVSGKNLVDRVGELLHEGNVTGVIVKDEADKTLLEIPATVGVVRVVVAPWLAALGVITVLVSNCRIVVERRE